MKYWIVKVVWVGPAEEAPFIEIEFRGVREAVGEKAGQYACFQLGIPSAYLKVTSIREM